MTHRGSRFPVAMNCRITSIVVGMFPKPSPYKTTPPAFHTIEIIPLWGPFTVISADLLFNPYNPDARFDDMRQIASPNDK